MKKGIRILLISLIGIILFLILLGLSICDGISRGVPFPQVIVTALGVLGLAIGLALIIVGLVYALIKLIRQK